MKNPDLLFYNICQLFANQSKCKSRHVGCVLVYENRVISQGFNSAPEGSTCEECPRNKCKGLNNETGKDLDKAICCHGESNCIGYAARHGIVTRGASLYVSTFPCCECAKLIVAAGIKNVIFQENYEIEIEKLSKLILQNAGINIRKFNI